MPYTTINNLSLIDPGVQDEAGFYPEDIAAVMNQPGANRVVNYIARLADGSSSDTFSVLVGADRELSLMDEPNHLAALGCPRFDHNAGVFLTDPELP